MLKKPALAIAVLTFIGCCLLIDARTDSPFEHPADFVEEAKREKCEAAIAELTKRIERNRDDADLLAERGFKYSLLGDYEKAIADYQAALKINPIDQKTAMRQRTARAMLALSASPSSSPTPLSSANSNQEAKASIFTITQLPAPQQADPDADTNLTFRFAINKQADAVIDQTKVRIQVLFYDVLDNQQIKLTDAEVNYEWGMPSHNWAGVEPEILSVNYRRPKNKAPASINSEDRWYLGYIARVYYGDNLQDEKAAPARLLKLFPASPPASLNSNFEEKDARQQQDADSQISNATAESAPAEKIRSMTSFFGNLSPFQILVAIAALSSALWIFVVTPIRSALRHGSFRLPRRLRETGARFFRFIAICASPRVKRALVGILILGSIFFFAFLAARNADLLRPRGRNGELNEDRFGEYARKLRDDAILEVEPHVFVPTSSRPETQRFPWKTNIVTTVFWIGEQQNYNSVWDQNWIRNYGGTDDPEPSARRNYIPVAFIPQQNPFYCALPYNDVSHGQFKPEAPLAIPWFKQAYVGPGQSVCQHRWVAIRKGNGICYAQWEDCGPVGTDDYGYVFQNERPKPNTQRGAGLSVSPAVRDYLALQPTDVTDWKFVDVVDIPPGPWRSYGENNPFVLARRQLEQKMVQPNGAAETSVQPAAASPAEACGQFVQEFYDWYLAKCKGADNALLEKRSSFSPELVKALQEDLAASLKAAEPGVGLDFDPFLAAQDWADDLRCPVGEVRRKGDHYFVEVFTSGEKDSEPVVAELAWQNGKWVFTNFHYGQSGSHEDENLVSILRQLKKDREKSGASSNKDRHIKDESTETTTIDAEANAIIDVNQGYLLGASTKGRWLDAEQSTKLLKPGKRFRVFSLNKEVGKAEIGKLQIGNDICPEIVSVPLSPEPLQPEYEKGVIAVDAYWNPLLRAARIGDKTQRIYIEAVRTFLIGADIKNPQVKITQLLVTDLDGDGKDEVLISATNYFVKDGERPQEGVPGSYSIVLLRSMVADKARTQLVAGEVYPKAKSDDAPPPNWYEVSAILDLDGDGKLEILVNSEYYEGGDSTIYRCSPAKIEKLLSVACGL